MPHDVNWYRTGTVSVTNGDTAVIGADTMWATETTLGSGVWIYTKAFPGDALRVGNYVLEILDVVDATHLTLAEPYPGTTQTGLAYAIEPISPLRHAVSDVGARVSALLNRTQGVTRLFRV